MAYCHPSDSDHITNVWTPLHASNAFTSAAA
jgi:hypothetical protein